MADKKISQLTAANTPLAGTEVLPIVQGGSTVKVSVADLTAGRTVNASEVVVASSTDAYPLLINVTAGSTAGVEFRDPTTTTNPVIGSRGNNLAVEAGGNEVIRFGSNNNITVNTGNLVIGTAAKGIDFSANTHAAGMTSELLNWYEEGLYTATLTPQTSGSITVNPTNNWNTLAYTRIGRVVHVQGGIRISAVSSPSGAVALNLPFTSANLTGDAGISVGIAVAQSLGLYNQPLAMYVGEGTATAIIQYMNLGTRTSVPGSDFSGDEELQFNITYIAA